MYSLKERILMFLLSANDHLAGFDVSQVAKATGVSERNITPTIAGIDGVYMLQGTSRFLVDRKRHPGIPGLPDLSHRIFHPRTPIVHKLIDVMDAKREHWTIDELARAIEQPAHAIERVIRRNRTWFQTDGNGWKRRRCAIDFCVYLSKEQKDFFFEKSKV